MYAYMHMHAYSLTLNIGKFSLEKRRLYKAKCYVPNKHCMNVYIVIHDRLSWKGHDQYLWGSVDKPCVRLYIGGKFATATIRHHVFGNENNV